MKTKASTMISHRLSHSHYSLLNIRISENYYLHCSHSRKENATIQYLFNPRSDANSLGNGRVPEGSNPQSVTTAPRNYRLCVLIK